MSIFPVTFWWIVKKWKGKGINLALKTYSIVESGSNVENFKNKIRYYCFDIFPSKFHLYPTAPRKRKASYKKRHELLMSKLSSMLIKTGIAAFFFNFYEGYKKSFWRIRSILEKNWGCCTSRKEALTSKELYPSKQEPVNETVVFLCVMKWTNICDNNVCGSYSHYLPS